MQNQVAVCKVCLACLLFYLLSGFCWRCSFGKALVLCTSEVLRLYQNGEKNNSLQVNREVFQVIEYLLKCQFIFFFTQAPVYITFEIAYQRFSINFIAQVAACNSAQTLSLCSATETKHSVNNFQMWMQHFFMAGWCPGSQKSKKMKFSAQKFSNSKTLKYAIFGTATCCQLKCCVLERV